MKIDHLNDLHLDFYIPETTNPKKLKQSVADFTAALLPPADRRGDVLIIAGDFGHINATSVLFLNAIAPHYDRVFATYGNHDLYLISKNTQNRYNRNSFRRVQELIDATQTIDNLTWLNSNMVYTHKGVTFAGNPMFAAPESPGEWLFYRQSMNDSRYIFFPWRQGLPELNYEGMRDYTTLPEHVDVFVSHYPLVKTPTFRNDASAGSYYNFVDALNADHFFFGHVHQRDHFETAGAHFHTHAIGYPDEGFDVSVGQIEI